MSKNYSRTACTIFNSGIIPVQEQIGGLLLTLTFFGSDANITGLIRRLISRNGQGWSLRAVRFCDIVSSYVHILSRYFYVSGVEGGMLPLSSWIVPHPFPDGLESHPCRFGLNPVPFGTPNRFKQRSRKMFQRPTSDPIFRVISEQWGRGCDGG